MPPRNPGLPEGTDQIIDTNIDLGDTGGGSGGSGAAGLGGGSGASSLGGGSGTGGLGGGSGASGLGGGAAAGGASAGTSSSGGAAGGSAFQFDKNGGGDSKASGIAGQVRDQISTLKSQASDRARSFADDGKRQTTDLLQTLAQVVADAAGSVEERLGGQYAGLGHKASGSIQSFAARLDERSVDDIIEDARSFVQRSPAAAIGVAALLGFAVARVVRSGVAEYTGGGSDNGMTGSNQPAAGSGLATGAMGSGASGGLDATSGGFGEQGVGTAGTMGGGVSTEPGSTGGTGNAPTF